MWQVQVSLAALTSRRIALGLPNGAAEIELDRPTFERNIEGEKRLKTNHQIPKKPLANWIN